MSDNILYYKVKNKKGPLRVPFLYLLVITSTGSL